MQGSSQRHPRPVVLLTVLGVLLPCFRAHTQAAAPIIAGGVTLAVTSVKPSAPGAYNQDRDIRADGVVEKNMPLYDTVRNAFRMDDSRALLGLPDWTGEERYDIVAKIAESDIDKYSKLTVKQQLQLLQLVLVERFGLKTHTETKTFPVWTLVVAKGGPKLTPATGSSAAGDEKLWQVTGSYTLTVKNGSMKDLCRNTLSQEAQQFTVDQTGLDGLYDFTLSWSRPGHEETAEAPEIFRAIKDQLGLQLVKRDLPETVIVVDEIHRPTPN